MVRPFGPVIRQPATSRHTGTVILLHGAFRCPPSHPRPPLPPARRLRCPHPQHLPFMLAPTRRRVVVTTTSPDLCCIDKFSLCRCRCAACPPGLGDTGDGWAPVGPQLNLPHLKFIYPTAPTRPITVNMGMVRVLGWALLHASCSVCMRLLWGGAGFRAGRQRACVGGWVGGLCGRGLMPNPARQHVPPGLAQCTASLQLLADRCCLPARHPLLLPACPACLPGCLTTAHSGTPGGVP